MIVKKIYRWLLNLFGYKKSSGQKPFSFIFVRELPEKIKINTLYIEGNESLNDFWYALMKCPCGCNEKIMLNLMDDATPYWKVEIEGSKVSISPSIWRKVNCKSHFWFTNSRVNWM